MANGKSEVILEEEIELKNDEEGLFIDDFGPKDGKFVNTPKVEGQEIVFTINKIVPNPVFEIKKKNGETFIKGLQCKDKSKKPERIDFLTDLGTWTLGEWEIAFKLGIKSKKQKDGKFSTGILQEYGRTHNTNDPRGARISIKRLVNTAHANYSLPDIMKLTGKSEAEAKIYKESLLKARNEGGMFEVKLLN